MISLHGNGKKPGERGAGEKSEYKPWLRVHHYSSSGKSTRVRGGKTGRMHTLFSDLEYHFFLLADWDDRVEDIQEQYPLLPSAEIAEICQALGVRAPRKPGEKEDMVMTTDFLLTTRAGREAWSIKPSRMLENRRVLEKLEVEMLYWKKRNVDLRIATEKEIPPVVIRNIKWARGGVGHPCEPSQRERVRSFLEPKVKGIPLGDACREADEALGLDSGSSLAVAKHLILTKDWKVDMGGAISHKTMLELL